MKCNELENQIIRIDFVRFNHVWHKPTLSLTPPHTRRHTHAHPMMPIATACALICCGKSVTALETNRAAPDIHSTQSIDCQSQSYMNKWKAARPLCHHSLILWKSLTQQTHAQVCLISWKVDGWRRGVGLSSALAMQLAAFNCCITWAEGTKRFVLRIQLLWERTQKKQQIKNLSNQETNKCLQMQANSWVIENAVAVAVVAALVVVVVVAASKVVFNI